MLPPYTDLPDINALLDEGKHPKPPKPQPPLKPPAICGYRDEKCKKIKEEKDKEKEKDKKVGQRLLPSAGKTTGQSASARQPEKRGWLGRFKRAVSGAIGSLTSGLSSSSARGSAFLPAATGSDKLNYAPAPVSPATMPAAPPPPPTFITLEQAKLDPHYRTGTPGEDLFSGNFNVSLPLVSLPGRNGLDLNLTLSYNSLVWLRYGSTMAFDYDYFPTLTPGFRLGFPEISYVNNAGAPDTWIVTLPSGRRVEMRLVAGTSDQYEAIDSSYLYLHHQPSYPSGPRATLYAPDGTQFLYTIPAYTTGYRCTKVSDSNGNFITITYGNIGTVGNPMGAITSMTDTLGRVLSFNYTNQRLMTITQAWQGQTFTWAQFDYGMQTIQTNFGSLAVQGPTNGSTIPVITRVITGDGARHTFVYNSWGQAYQIWRYGEVDNPRQAMIYVFPDTSVAQTDCPRFNQRNDGIYGWAGQTYDPSTGFGWVSTYFYFPADESQGWATPPDGVTYKEYFNTSTSGGLRGLPYRTETVWNNQLQKYTEITWAGDSTSGVPVHPRVTDAKVTDDINHNGTYESGTDKRSRTSIVYTTLAGTVKLPSIVKEYDEGGGTVYRSTKTDYQATTNYISIPPPVNVPGRRIVGLPSLSRLYQGDAESGGTLVAQTGFVYDSPNDTTTYLQAHSSTPSQHDSTNYGAGFLYRGNLTKVQRYSVTNGAAGAYLETKTGYYTTGNVALTKDALSHQTSFIYDDLFLHITEPTPGTLSTTTVTKSPATFAYPTRVTDPDGFSATMSYNYDFGAVTRTVDPKEYAAHGANPVTMGVNTYDTRGRLDKALVWKDGAKYSQTRFAYATDHNWLQRWTTINTLNEETYVVSLLDGASRERITISEHPGSAGGLKSAYKVFDIAGRVTEWSRPTEINGSWAPSGDDTDYKISTQTYDWKSRPLVTTGFDGATRQVIYTGCGCAGGDTTEFQSEIVNGATGRRRTLVYRDTFGRAVKTETLDWSGNIYSSSTTNYNVRDQVTFGRAYQGDITSGTYQETKLEYDSYGRLWRRWLPLYKPLATDIPGPGQYNQYDEYEYFDNDLLKKKTDPRGATITYGYNNRDLVTAISYGVTGNVTPTPNVTFGYDQAGNRTSMDDGPGTVTYNYNMLSELTSETRVFDQPGDPGGSLTLSYEYNLAGQVKKVTDPWNASISYAFNRAGEVTAVTGNGYADLNQWTNRAVTNFATGIKYRAWGDLKEFTSGNFATNRAWFSMLYDNSMRLTRFEGSGRVTEHDYYADGRVKEVRSPDNNDYKRTYNFDHVGRLITANAIRTPTSPNDPYAFTFQYDAWGDTTLRSGSRWNTALPNFTATWANGRNTNSTHDAAGNQTATTPGATTQTQRYDAAGRPSSNTVQTSVFGINDDTVSYDGDGRVVRRVTESRIGSAPFSTAKRHFVRSSVLGGAVIGELQDKNSSLGSDPNRFENRTYVYLNGERIAYQRYTDRSGPDKEVVWVYKHPLIGTLLETNKLTRLNAQSQPEALEYFYGYGYFDPLGADLGYDPATLPPPVQIDDPLAQLQFGDITNYSSGCVMDGVRTNCNIVQSALNNGWAADVPWGVSGLTWNPQSQVWQSAEGFVADWDNGYFGFIPEGATYGGNGTWSWGSPRPTLNAPGTYERKHGRGFTPEPEPQPAKKKHNHNFVPWVVRNVKRLERIIQNDDRQGRTVNRWTDGNGVTNCASLPMKWDYDNGRPIQQMHHPERGVWQMGVAITPDSVRGLTRGTVIATFDRDRGIYLNKNSGNHTAIFLSYYGETDRRGNFTVTGIWVLEQGPRWPTRGRQIPFDSTAIYHSDAGRFNVVKICESHNPKLPFE